MYTHAFFCFRRKRRILVRGGLERWLGGYWIGPGGLAAGILTLQAQIYLSYRLSSRDSDT